jgi:hypothetical protein
MSIANSLWGAPRIHGELLKLGIDVGQTTVAKSWRRGGGHRPKWKIFFRNHADAIASMDMFVVPTISFRLLYGLLILRHSRRELLWLGGTEHPKRRMHCRSTDRSLRLARRAAVSRSRSGFRLWRRLHPAPWSNGHTGSTDLGTIAVAKRVCG